MVTALHAFVPHFCNCELASPPSVWRLGHRTLECESSDFSKVCPWCPWTDKVLFTRLTAAIATVEAELCADKVWALRMWVVEGSTERQTLKYVCCQIVPQADESSDRRFCPVQTQI